MLSLAAEVASKSTHWEGLGMFVLLFVGVLEAEAWSIYWRPVFNIVQVLNMNEDKQLPYIMLCFLKHCTLPFSWNPFSLSGVPQIQPQFKAYSLNLTGGKAAHIKLVQTQRISFIGTSIMSQMFLQLLPHLSKCHSTCLHTCPPTAHVGTHAHTRASAHANEPAGSVVRVVWKKNSLHAQTQPPKTCIDCNRVDAAALLLSSPAAILRNEHRRSDACSCVIMSSDVAQAANLPVVQL